MEKHVNSEELVKLQIKFGGQTIPLSMNLNSTIADLKLLLKSSTNVLPRGQKLIHKGFFFSLFHSSIFLIHSIIPINIIILGNVLEDSKTLKASNITNGSKIMLMASQGLHQGVHIYIYIYIIFF